MSNLDVEDQKARSPLAAALGTLFLFAMCVLCGSAVLEALLTGKTRFPARYNRTDVTWADNPGWFVASLGAWLLMTVLMAHVSIRGCKQFLGLIRGNSSPER